MLVSHQQFWKSKKWKILATLNKCHRMKITYLQDLIKILSADGIGVSSCFLNFLLTLLKLPPFTGKIMYMPLSSVNATSWLSLVCLALENFKVVKPSSIFPSVFVISWLGSRIGCKYPVVHMSMMKDLPLVSANPMTASVKLWNEINIYYYIR